MIRFTEPKLKKGRNKNKKKSLTLRIHNLGEAQIILELIETFV